MTIRHGAQLALLAVTCVIAERSTTAQQPAAASGPQTAALSTAIPNDPQITTGRFANGLRYYIRTNKKPEKRAELRLVVNAGSILEDDDQRGLAHFVEHMAFNGTKNFPKQEIVQFLESIGMRFGPSVNAFTSFDETVYMLQVPTDKPEVLDKAFLILEDWAHNVSFDPAEIDKERGVIIEEWRLRRGAGARMHDKQFPVLLKGSRYAERLPIGNVEIIQTLQARAAEEVLHRLVPARPDGGRRGRRLRQGGGRSADQEALRNDPGVAGDQASPVVQRARSPGHAVRDHDRQGSVVDERHGLQQDAASRPDHGRRVPPADGRAPVQRHAVDPVFGDRAETGRAVSRRQRRPRALRPDEGSVDAQRARQGRRRSSAASRRSSPKPSASRGSASPRRSSIGRRRTSCAASSAPWPRRTTSESGPLADEYVRNFTRPRADPRHRVRSGAPPAVPAGDHARRGQRAGEGLGPRRQPRRRRQRARERRRDDSRRDGAGRGHGVGRRQGR